MATTFSKILVNWQPCQVVQISHTKWETHLQHQGHSWKWVDGVTESSIKTAVCLFFILTELLLEWSLLPHAVTWSPHSYLKLLGCNFLFTASFTMWSIQLAALSRLQALLNFMSCFAPTISSTTAHFSDWPRLSCLHSLFWAAAWIVSTALLLTVTVWQVWKTLRATFCLLIRWHNTIFRVKLHRVSLPTDHLGRRIGQAYVHVTDKEKGDWALQKQNSKMRHR